MRKKGFPKERELVICQITEINPNSAFAEILEYKKKGMIHVSEVAKRWVRDIREFLKEKQYVVCTVIGIEKDHIYLSLKKVYIEDAERKLNEFKRERKSEKALELIGKKMKKTLDEAYDEVGYTMQEEFGSLTKAFEIAAKNPELLDKKGISKGWKEELIRVGKKINVRKVHIVISNLKLICYQPDGINIIKKALADAEKKGFEVRYVSSPKYQLILKGKNLQEVEEKLEEISKVIVNKIKKNNGEAEFKLTK